MAENIQAYDFCKIKDEELGYQLKTGHYGARFNRSS